ncbi:MAG: polyprenyl synthetase family protein [Cytophagales bacterium]|nr:polyprenyl synthetase family protein [Cytophagales bacterium]
MTFDFDAWRAAKLARVEAALDGFIAAQSPADLGLVMRYGVLNGGKRLRALLVLAASEATGGNADAAMRAACAVEMIHAYSLIHDDMPCMDNDVLRRGKPTVHVAYGEAQALLAGDALQALAFEVLTPDEGVMSASVQATLCRQLARASGVGGMAGGQAIDLASVSKTLTEAQLRRMHELKTGALLKASVEMGAACGVLDGTRASHGALGLRAHLAAYGAAVGLAFQVVDDMLDVIADAALLGKTAGKDAAHNKPTYVALMGLDAAETYAEKLLAQALTALDACALPNDAALRELAIRLVKRQS